MMVVVLAIGLGFVVFHDAFSGCVWAVVQCCLLAGGVLAWFGV